MVAPIFSAKMFGIGGDSCERLRRGLEQRVVDRRFVGVSDGGDRRRQREHNVEVAHRQKIGAARLEPSIGRRGLALAAMPIAARIISDVAVATFFARADVPAECGGAAGFDRRHCTQLAETQMSGMRAAVCGTGGTEDIRNLQRWTRQELARSGGR